MTLTALGTKGRTGKESAGGKKGQPWRCVLPLSAEATGGFPEPRGFVLRPDTGLYHDKSALHHHGCTGSNTLEPQSLPCGAFSHQLEVQCPGQTAML